MSSLLREQTRHARSVRALNRVSGPLRREKWTSRYSRRLLLTDALLIVATLAASHLLRFGVSGSIANLGGVGISYVVLAACLAVVWLFLLEFLRSRDDRFIGSGSAEYRQVARASLLCFGLVAIASLLLQWDLSRGYLALAFSIGPIALLTGRRLWRSWLKNQRANGQFNSAVLVIGGLSSGRVMAKQFEENVESGLRVRGVWVPDQNCTEQTHLDLVGHHVPVFGAERTLFDVLGETNVDTVAVTDSEHFGAAGMRELAWELEALGVDLLVAPNVLDVAGSRVAMRTVANRPILYIDEPQYEGAGKWGKVLFDRAGALLLLLFFLPVMLVLAAAIKFTSPGGVLFRHERVGLNGRSFRMLKFRSMREGASEELVELLRAQGAYGTPLFKVGNDPRITKIGAVLRRYSLDELPQLLNVLRGEMSLVGPRPQVTAEVNLYDDRAKRRLHVKPGMTGLWQVSGRSNLTWEEAVQLDLYYVENWSIMADLSILFKTLRAVVGSDGAY